MLRGVKWCYSIIYILIVVHYIHYKSMKEKEKKEVSPGFTWKGNPSSLQLIRISLWGKEVRHNKDCVSYRSQVRVKGHEE